ncbi:MAG: response regulator [Ignavibacteriaceae bacterium]|nr:response regulator [Ignavibacteriaceae bacterium]
MSPQNEEFLKRLRATFRIEAREHLETISASLLGLDSLAPQEITGTVELIFREAHSLKGAARAVNENEIELVCQYIESIFSLLKKSEISYSPYIKDMLISAVDLMTIYMNLTEPEDQKAHGKDLKNLAEQLKSFAEGGHQVAGVHAHKEIPSHRPVEMTGEKTPPVKRELKKVVIGSARVPAAKTQPVSAEKPAEPRPAPAETILPAEKPATATERESVRETLRIASEKIDTLLLKTEELLNIKLMIGEYEKQLNDSLFYFQPWKKEWEKIQTELRYLKNRISLNDGMDYRDKKAITEILNYIDWNHSLVFVVDSKLSKSAKDLARTRHSVSQMIDSTLTDVKDIMMMPASSMLSILPKMVYDISRELGKVVDLDIKGGDIEIDRRILDELKDPLIHLVRNAADHGLEKPEIRLRRKKSGAGKLRVILSNIDSSKFEILVEDDGNGIDVERVKEKAVKNGLITQKEAFEMSLTDAYALIFKSDISTSPVITDLSGRGLGMSIVLEKVEKLGGNIITESEPEKFTRFRLILPLSVATLRGVLVKTGEDHYVIPSSGVEKVLRVKNNEIKSVENKETVFYSGKTIPLAPLRGLLELPDTHRKEEPVHTNVMVLFNSENMVGVSFDELVDEAEFLIKPFNRQLQRIRNVSAATVLGSGQIVPVLNISDLIKSSLEFAGELRVRSKAAEQPSREEHNILVVDDSITSRMLLKDILESAGYNVKVAIDGVEALTALRSDKYHAVVTDIEMPRMNGFELTYQIRKEEKLKNTPVVLVTALSSPEDRERGIEAGADAYIVKSSFDQSNLLDIVERLI